MSPYAELHALSNFSFLRGASHPAELVTRAHALGYRALALTDECSLAGVVRAHEAVQALPPAAAPIPAVVPAAIPEVAAFKLIVGAEFRTACGLKLVLLAPSQQAYGQICQLITLGRRRSKKGQYQLLRADFETGLADCLALWVPPVQPSEAQAAWLRDFFPERGWLAVELHRGADDAARLAQLRQLAERCGVPAVAAGDVHMHRRGRRALQDVLTAVRHGCTVDQAGARLYPNAERHLRPLVQLRTLYPQALLEQSVAIAERCVFSLAQLHYEYPAELVPAGLTASAHLRALTETGLRRRWPRGVPESVRALVEKELALIAELRYEHFFLTVHDLVEYARQEHILCQGRGSAANSAVCYALGITEIDPARTQLLFERFISRERNEPPDIDVDFEHERREQVIQYIYRKYGRERAALAATVISYRTRSAIRDVARALGIPESASNRLARSHMWWDPPGEIQHDTASEDLGGDGGGGGGGIEPAQLRRLRALVLELVGFPRHLSQHVGGFVISGEPLCTLVPIENAAMADRTVIQWDKDDLESLGLLKVDVLALGMLTALRRCFDLIAEYRGSRLSMQDIPPRDTATFDMICRAETVGVFQIESRAQMSMLPRLRPRCFYDLVIEVAIVRPGPIQGDMVHPYLQRRENPQTVTYPSEALKAVLQRTLGVPIFQEQVMQIAIVAADFTPGEADGLRRAMAAWKRRGGLTPYRERLLSGMARNGYTSEFAEQIYRQILGFGDYGFPESHAASFALLTYISCWLKCHEPAAFAAALINSQPMGFYAPAQITQELRRSGVHVLVVDVTVSHWDCTLERTGETDAPALRLGLRLVRNLRAADAARIVAERSAHPYTGIDDLGTRARLSRHTLQSLAAAGALTALSAHRHEAHWRALGVERLPGLIEGLAAGETSVALPQPTESQNILADYRHLGLTSGRHPLALLRPALSRRGFHSSRELALLPEGSRVRVSGLVTHMQQPATASGVVFASLEDETGIVNVILWPKVFDAQRRCALESSLLVVEGTLQRRDQVAHVIARRLHDASRWLGNLARDSRDFH